MSGLLEELMVEVVALREEVVAMRSERPSAPGLLDATGAAELLSLSLESVRTLSKRRLIPRLVLPNGRVRYDRDELLAWARGETA